MFAFPAHPPVPCVPQSIAIVGNAPGMSDRAARIDAADWVVRFNNPAGFGGPSGRRITHLALVNHGGQMREWLEDPSFVARACVRDARTILFPFPRKAAPLAANDEDGRDWTDEAIARLAPHDTPVEILPPEVHRAAAALLPGQGGTRPAPSTGLLVALHLVFRFGGRTAIDVYGFGFEGWEAHDWARERRWFHAMHAEGMLRLHPLQEKAAA